jgi:glycosyl transferase family 25
VDDLDLDGAAELEGCAGIPSLEHLHMTRLPDLFGVTYLINLPERVDRLKSAKRQLSSVNWDVGPDGVRVFPALRYVDPAGFPNAPTRGCFHSHLECLRSAHAERRQSVLILEDDIGLSSTLPRLTSSIKSLLANLEWDFVYFGHDISAKVPMAHRDMKESEFRFDLWRDEILNTHFYGINGRILPRLIAHLDSLSAGRMGDQDAGPMPIDGAYNIFRRNNLDVQCLLAYPTLGWQLSSRSDITPQSWDQLVFLRPVNNLLRRFKRVRALWRT